MLTRDTICFRDIWSYFFIYVVCVELMSASAINPKLGGRTRSVRTPDAVERVTEASVIESPGRSV